MTFQTGVGNTELAPSLFYSTFEFEINRTFSRNSNKQTVRFYSNMDQQLEPMNLGKQWHNFYQLDIKVMSTSK
jgi:hypothetical protein